MISGHFSIRRYIRKLDISVAYVFGMLITLSTNGTNEQRRFEEKESGEGILRAFSVLTDQTVAMRFNGKLMDLSAEISEDGEVSPVEVNSPDGIHILRHSGAHLLAQAVMELYKGALPTIGPVTEDPPGFYYDIWIHDFDSNDLNKIEAKMKEIVQRNYKIIRKQLKKDELLEMFKWNKFKVELIDDNVPDGTESSIYTQGEFTDFCLGPHVPSTGYLKSLKLLSVSNAYWKADENNESLVRIYGTAYPKDSQLKEYLQMMEEAKKRDHRKIGNEMDLFLMRPEYAPAFPIYTPKGVVLRNELINYMKYLNEKVGYEEVWTPNAFKTSLWEKSGHMSHYKENMFLMQIENEQYGMKPMNCPGHILIFQRKSWSYRELPVKYAEFGTVYRYERSGVTSGLLRVRAMTQDDGHAFIRMDQIEEEVGKLIDVIKEIYLETFQIKELKFKLSTRDEENKEKFVGSSDVWKRATEALKKALENRGIEFDTEEGEAAFYGPKIDVDVRDAVGRFWQLSTVQLDFFMPDQSHFDLKYIDQNNSPQQPVMIHRALYGTLDRFLGVMIEHFAGSFPVWLSPVQVKVLNISEDSQEYANRVSDELQKEGVRVERDLSNDTIGKKIRNAHKEKVPYLLIIGEKEEKEGRVSIRDRKDRQKNLVGLSEFINNILKEIRSKTTVLEICK